VRPITLSRAPPHARRRVRALCLAACLVSLSACFSDRGPPDPKTLPWYLESGERYLHLTSAVDLDGDGQDEIVYRYVPGSDKHRTPVGTAVIVATHTGRIIDQLNYDGAVRQPPLYADVNADGQLEVLVPVVRNDSLFVSVVNSRGQKLYSFFLIDGQPRHEPEGVLAWDPWVKGFYVTDADGDGRNDLVTVVSTAYARLPRGVLVHRLPDGQRLGQVIVGSFIGQSILDDFDGDGEPEILAATYAVNNGAEAGGFDDRHTYVLLFELGADPEIAWFRKLGDSGFVHIAHEDVNGDGRREIVLINASGDATRLELIEDGTWRSYRQLSLPEPLFVEGAPPLIDIDRDGRLELLMAQRPGEIWLFDDNLDLIRRRPVAQMIIGLRTWPDLDGDGIDEIAVNHSHGDGFVLLDRHLRPKATYDEGSVSGVLHRGRGIPRSLLVDHDGRTTVLRLARNPTYLLHRYGPLTLWLLGLVGASLVGLVLYALLRRNRLLRSIQSLALDPGPGGFLLLDREGRVRWMNETLQSRLGLDRVRAKPPRNLAALSQRSPDLVSFCQDALAAQPAERKVFVGPMAINGERRPARMVAEPVQAKVHGDPHWLVRISDGRESADSDLSGTWAMMARRVAHDVKSPLTTILLTLQRLQMEYRERAPSVASRFDRYSTRIEERVAELRHLTNSFLKFTNIEEPELTDVEVNHLVEELGECLRRSLPSDIRLKLKLERGLPTVSLDRDLIMSALNNLVDNAVDAMIEGGTITISTGLARGVKPSAECDVGDYVELEVMDTGSGVPDDLKGHLFDPGFSTAENGSGLGLAIVKKIVSDHGGVVTVESEAGAGSAFSIYLPVKNRIRARGTAGTRIEKPE